MGSVTAIQASLAAAEVGQPIPDTAHAVSVSLPSWRANVGYEEGQEWVVSKMKSGYPRFFVHLGIQSFAAAIVSKYGRTGEEAMLFPTKRAAERCKEFILRKRIQQPDQLSRSLEPRILDLVLDDVDPIATDSTPVTAICAVIMPASDWQIAKSFWQHTGEGVSSRRAEIFRKAFDDGHLLPRSGTNHVEQLISPAKGPKRYRRQESTMSSGNQSSSVGQAPDVFGTVQFLEERFGRNLDMSLSRNAKLAIRKRIAGVTPGDTNLQPAIPVTEPMDQPHRKDVQPSVDDVYLYSCGMNAIFNAHQTLLRAKGPSKSVMFGFPYVDTLKILENWGPGCQFYGHGNSDDLDDLQKRLESGERFLSLFCEFPGNPLLKTPDLQRIRKLADKYDFAVVVDETIGNFFNVNILPSADIVVSSLTKIFSGDSNVMGGSAVLNPKGQYYDHLTSVMREEYEDNYWAEDAIYMERNSRDFESRNNRVNQNSEKVCDLLQSSPLIKQVYYPKFSESRPYFETFRTAHGGYGGLFSITFHSTEDAIVFFDTLETAKGPSLGTNFTLSCPFVILAHYNELDWAAQFGAEANLVRVSTGLEESSQLITSFERALNAIKTRRESS